MAAIEYKWLSMSNFDIPIHLARMVMVEVDCEWVGKEFTLYLLWQDFLSTYEVMAADFLMLRLMPLAGSFLLLRL